MKAATCHPDRYCHARGLCNMCYKRERKLKTVLSHPKRQSKAKDKKYTRRTYLDGPLTDKVQKMMDNWLPKLEDPAIVVDIVRRIFHTQKELKGVYSA